jgi:predicted ATPase
MKYRESNLDKKLRKWFCKDNTKALLRSISVTKGGIRGLTSFKVNIDYPITAFAGVNGSGKSTMLALASCAYHNKADGYKLPKRTRSYYTFSDFFVQHSEEIAPPGVEIWYSFAHDNWKSAPVGIASQVRKKKAGGKWNDYHTRIKRTVVFLGIERIVPHAERSQSRSYSRSFKDLRVHGWENKVRDAVGYVLGKRYDDYRQLEYRKYGLPIVKVGDVIYSGFNMGAGENALFDIFSTIYASGEGALLVLDEIELGLHAKAQRLFIERLKEVCMSTGTQVICTTHSKQIFQCLPDDARFFIESNGGKTKITPGVSAEFAFSKMGAIGEKELEIFVEDPVAKVIIETVLDGNTRSRVNLTRIGSAAAVARQLAANFLRNEHANILAVYDADQRKLQAKNIEHAKSMAERNDEEITKWLLARTSYLPGDTWPEAWLFQKCGEIPEELGVALGVDAERAATIVEYALQAGKHEEFSEVSEQVNLDPERCLILVCGIVYRNFPDEFEELKNTISEMLP